MQFPKFQITIGQDKQYYFHLYAANGENILDSEGYTRKATCLNGVDSVKQNAQDEENFSRKEAENGQFYFVLLARNGEIIGKSEMYNTQPARDNGIQAVMKVATDAPVEQVEK